MATSKDDISESIYEDDVWDRLDLHLGSYVKSSLHSYYVNPKTATIGRALRQGIVDLLDNITNKATEYIENDTTIIGTEHRLAHSRNYTFKSNEERSNDDDDLECEISSLAPTVFSRLREDIGISNEHFRRSFSEFPLKDFTNPGKSGSLMYKTSDELFILKTLREYEARLLLQILSGYHIQLTQRQTIFNRYIGLYSVRLQVAISTIEIFVVVMASAFAPSLQLNEVYDLKGSTIKRKSAGYLCPERLHKLKDVDFMDLYPDGIRIPTAIYQKLKLVVANDAKVLRKLNVTDFSLILGIRHLDHTETELIKQRASTGLAALCSMSNRMGLVQMMRVESDITSPTLAKSSATSVVTPFLKPLKMLNEQIDSNLYYHDDMIARLSLPIPGIVNKTNQRVYLYLAFVDMLQTFDSFKLLDQTYRKLAHYNKRLEYSVIEPDDYEKRINYFLFKHVFIDAEDDFPWNITDLSKPVVEMTTEELAKTKTTPTRRRPHPIECEHSDPVLEFRF